MNPKPLFKIEGIDSVLKELNQVSDGLNLNEVALEIKRVIDRAANEQLQTQGGRSGKSFAPLSPATIKDRLRKGFRPGPPLIRTGGLLNDATDSEVKLSANGKSLEFNFDNELIGIHAAGNDDLPARDPIGLTQQDLDEISAIVLRNILEDF